MKAFIWHFEYDYIIVLAEDQASAYVKANELYEKNENDLGHYRADVTDDGHLLWHAPQIVEVNEAKIIQHSNE